MANGGYQRYGAGPLDDITTAELKKNFLAFAIDQGESTALRVISWINILWTGFWMLFLIGFASHDAVTGKQPVGFMIFVVFLGWAMFVSPLWFIIYAWQARIKQKYIVTMMERIRYQRNAYSLPPPPASPAAVTGVYVYDGTGRKTSMHGIEAGNSREGTWDSSAEDTTGDVEAVYPDRQGETGGDQESVESERGEGEEQSVGGRGKEQREWEREEEESGGEQSKVVRELIDNLVAEARELEAKGRYDEALILYDQCGMMDDVDRVVMLAIGQSDNNEE